MSLWRLFYLCYSPLFFSSQILDIPKTMDGRSGMCSSGESVSGLPWPSGFWTLLLISDYFLSFVYYPSFMFILKACLTTRQSPPSLLPRVADTVSTTTKHQSSLRCVVCMLVSCFSISPRTVVHFMDVQNPDETVGRVARSTDCPDLPI